jgi:hypothetical protein
MAGDKNRPTKAMTKHRNTIPSAPKEPSPKEVLAGQVRAEWRDKSIDELTAEYNRLEAIKKEQSAAHDKTSTTMDALEGLIQKKIEALNLDNLSVNGYTWTPQAKAYATQENPQALIQYFIDNGQAHLLMIHGSRLNAMIREEIDAGTILIEPKEVVDPATGETRTVNEVRSSVLPGVRVYLEDALGRAKSTRTKEKVEA